MPSLLIVDPLTLLGREMLQVLPRMPALAGAVRYLHTDDDDEHQIAELGGEPGLVPALTASEDLEGADVVLIASDRFGARREHLDRFLDAHPESSVIGLGRSRALRDRLDVACPGLTRRTDGRHLRVPDPALAAAAALISPLSGLGLRRIAILSVDPVSELGGTALEDLAAQSIERLQGMEPERLLDGQVRAFNALTVDEDQLQEDAASLFAGREVVASRVLGGCFHGHLVHLTLGFEDPLEGSELDEAWSASSRLDRMSRSVALDAAVGRDEVLVSPPVESFDKRLFSVTAAVDGLRVGGATTALELLLELFRL